LYDELLPHEPVPGAHSGPTRSPFLNRCSEVLRVRHYALRTEDCYIRWIRRFIQFHGNRRPEGLGAPEIEAFLTYESRALQSRPSPWNRSSSFTCSRSS